jgi:hypothetical protein
MSESWVGGGWDAGRSWEFGRERDFVCGYERTQFRSGRILLMVKIKRPQKASLTPLSKRAAGGEGESAVSGERGERGEKRGTPFKTMAEEHQAASTAAPPTGKGGIGNAHAASTSVGSSGGDMSTADDVYDGEEECEPCPKVSSASKFGKNGGGGGGGMGVGGLDSALRAERGSPYAKPSNKGGLVSF